MKNAHKIIIWLAGVALLIAGVVVFQDITEQKEIENV
jgi:cytochrome c-type biogenesis protein CcmH/NrfF